MPKRDAKCSEAALRSESELQPLRPLRGLRALCGSCFRIGRPFPYYYVPFHITNDKNIRTTYLSIVDSYDSINQRLHLKKGKHRCRPATPRRVFREIAN